jgi:hypothetical protein
MNNKNWYGRKIGIITGFLFMMFSVVANAENPGGDGSEELTNPLGVGSIGELLTLVLGMVVYLGTPVVTIAIIYSGFKFLWARGSASELETAKKNLWYVLIGAAIILGAQALRIVIEGTINDIKSGL